MATIKNYALTTLARFKVFAAITISSDDDLITDLINQATEYIERYCGRRFKKTIYTNEEIDSDGSGTLFIKNYPIDSASSFTLKERNSESNEDDWDTVDSEDYFVNYDAGLIYKVADGLWVKGRKMYRVSYTAGYDFNNSTTYLSDTGAGDLEYAIWKLVKSVYDKKTIISGIRSESIGDYSVSYGRELYASSEIKEILDRYAKFDTIGGGSPYLF